MVNQDKSNSLDKKLDDIINQVIDTFSFHGVSVTDMTLEPDGTPSFSVSISKQKRYRTLDDTLNFVYWTLWTLLYGEYAEEKSDLILNLDYKEVG